MRECRAGVTCELGQKNSESNLQVPRLKCLQMLVYSGEAKDQANLFLSSRSSRSANLTGEGTGVLMSGSGDWAGQGVFGGLIER